MKLYCEKVTYDFQTKVSEVILDFNDESDIDKLSEQFQVPREGENKSVIILEDVKFERGTGFRSGKWYDIPIDIFENFTYIEENEGNSRVFLTLQQKDIILNIKQYLTSSLYYMNRELYSESVKGLQITDQDELKLIVRNVGCGNWNEIKNSSFWLIYDLGGDIKFTKQEMEDVFERIKFDREFIAVISHWDLDHYRAILDLQESQLEYMKQIIVPSKIPNNIQVQKTFKRLKQLNIAIRILLPTPKKRRTIDLQLIQNEKNLKVYRSSDGSSMNMSGIVLVVEGQNKVCILTGDHHYSQLNRNVLPVLPQKPLELVVPHHGGAAGKFDTTNLDMVCSLSGAISTQSNRYKNLPLKSNYLYFRNRGFHCTECTNQDYIAQL